MPTQWNLLEVGAEPRLCTPDDGEAACEVVVSVSDCTISKLRIPSPAE
jgi:hypothetical protein